MKTNCARCVTVIVLAFLSACGSGGPERQWLSRVEALSTPSAPGSRYPNLAGGDGTPVVMSWLQAEGGDRHSLRFATWQGDHWTDPATVTSGSGWFVNWADFPSVVLLDERHWAAHWLQQRSGNVYAYDVRLAVTRDAGTNWSEPISPHDDGTATEHGFVSLVRAGDRHRLQVVWLDGRDTAGAHDHDSGDEGSNIGAMTLRTTTVDENGRRIGPDLELDGRVCDCCQTDVARTADGLVVVYRDRSNDELRDIGVVRLVDGKWSAPSLVHADGWRIDACPVNGPAVDSRAARVAVAWFTAADGPRVRLAFSDDAGRSFGSAIEVASGEVIGRVDVVLLDDGRAVVSWMRRSGRGAEIVARPFDPDGAAGIEVVVASAAVQRSSGFPQMIRAGEELLFAWTDSSDPAQVRTARARLH
jgi:hypothetical protein